MPFRNFGGVHPSDKKATTNQQTSAPIEAPKQVFIPMSLHIGAPCVPIVSVGEYVKRGQKVGDSEAAVSAPIHSPISGTVIKIEPRLHANGSKMTFVVIENDYKYALSEDVFPRRENEVYSLTPEEITSIIREKGIVGMGGATFPTAFKITSGLGKVDTVIINGAECEPYITSDHRTMLEHPNEVLIGIALLMKACRVEKASLGIECNKKDAIELLRSKGVEKLGINIVELPCRYPQGAEKQLIQAITGREIPPGGLPASVGCAVFNTFTAYEVYRAVYEQMPVVERVITVSGSAVSEPKNLIVPIGTPISYVFEQAGGFWEEPSKIIMGGPMMGLAMYSLDVPTIKGTNALLAFTEKEDRTVENPQCIRCGKCVNTCPMNLMPLYLYMYEQKSDYDNMEKYHITDCIECGACTFACPARLHLTHSCRTGKAKLIAKANLEKAKREGK
ncbi:electron transport complex subunit RsxC [Clostridiaceae bacterium OttesenSCG-928-D20]|nr:electron transport complex subunit RsxC [Clostridiaceae bacterium OttesenSCG-928-D20]